MDGQYNVIALMLPGNPGEELTQMAMTFGGTLQQAESYLQSLELYTDCVAAGIYDHDAERYIAIGDRSYLRYTGFNGVTDMTLSDWNIRSIEADLQPRALEYDQRSLMEREMFAPLNEFMFQVVWMIKGSSLGVRRIVLDEQGLAQLAADPYIEIVEAKQITYTTEEKGWMRLIGEYKLREMAKLESERFPRSRTLIAVKAVKQPALSPGYLVSVMGVSGTIYKNHFAGKDIDSTAEFVLTAIRTYSETNPVGGTLKAPAEILNAIPKDLHSILPEYANLPVNTAVRFI